MMTQLQDVGWSEQTESLQEASTVQDNDGKVSNLWDQVSRIVAISSLSSFPKLELITAKALENMAMPAEP